MGNALARTLLRLAGPTLIGAGGAAWYVITRELKAQKIEVHPDSPSLQGRPVAGPVTAFAQAAVMEKHALAIGGGRTFAEISEEWIEATEAGDEERAAELSGTRETVMQANLLRASLFTSVLAYGVSALTMGVGVLSCATASVTRTPRAARKH
ncbi:aromatic ring-opening dioxygenase LigA [Raineyella sp. LH-20]|uniref:aromatic ring-opening dioxygenase LigA n=1 Tax=Raineyella sp. LH-20 TaxID=3081204 RepID=UPI0029543EF1|nr:aromatic ring-opening dioxygenase LigA [Raineyella sp. LH-20]WOP18173.1 aromatic ring-opening dioxygenase LigA [Raineyella sp. LH-20]